MKVFRTKTYKKKISRLMTEAEIISAESEIFPILKDGLLLLALGESGKPELQEAIQAKVGVLG